MNSDRQLLAALRKIAADEARAADCPDTSALTALALGTLDPAECGPLLDHVVACAGCRAALRAALALVAHPPIEMPSVQLRPRTTRRRRWQLPLAAAATLAVAVSLGMLLHGVHDDEPPLRGVDTVSAPADGARLRQAPELLEWQPLPGAAGYRVELMDANANRIWHSAPLTETSLSLPPEVRARLGPGLWLWQIEVDLGSGTRELGPYAFEVGR